MDALGAVFDEHRQNFQMRAIGRGAVDNIANGDYADVGTLFEIAWCESIFADFVECLAWTLPRAKKARGVCGNRAVQDLFAFVDICATNNMILGDRLDDRDDIRLCVRKFDREARTPTVTLVFASRGDARGQLKEDE